VGRVAAVTTPPPDATPGPPPGPTPGPTPGPASAKHPRLDIRAFVERVAAAAGPDGRLSPAQVADAEIFPFEGPLRVKELAAPVEPEPARAGESATDCHNCALPDTTYLWTSTHWRLRILEGRAVPTLMLEPRAHLDLADLDDRAARELGALTVAVARALEAVPGVARAHVHRWGDGAAHLHIWFFGRPAGLLQLRGSCLPDWLDLLPPLPAESAQAIGEHVAQALHWPER